MEIEMPRPETGSSGLPPAALLPRATRIAVWFPGVMRI